MVERPGIYFICPVSGSPDLDTDGHSLKLSWCSQAVYEPWAGFVYLTWHFKFWEIPREVPDIYLFLKTHKESGCTEPILPHSSDGVNLTGSRGLKMRWYSFEFSPPHASPLSGWDLSDLLCISSGSSPPLQDPLLLFILTAKHMGLCLDLLLTVPTNLEQSASCSVFLICAVGYA